MTTTTARSDVGLRSERGPVLLALMMTTGLVALDSTIIATAVPSIVDDLGGFSQFPWLFSIYLLTQAVTVPLYGKFADIVGRKPVMFLGIAVFLLGSVLCGVAWSMPALIVARAVQGIGAGAVQPISMTVVGDLYSVEERSRVQGYLASVWGVSSVVGPLLGGAFSQYLSWRWIFFVNLPLGAYAAWMLARHFSENVEHRRHRIDYAGAVLLMTGCSLLILGLLEGGVSWGWTSTSSVAVLGTGVLAVVVFLFVERRAAEPVLPLWVFQRRTLIGGNLAALAVGGLLIGLTSYVPTYVQGVLGTGAVVAGLAVGALTLGWPIAAGQSVVGWDRRGTVTGTNMFCRSIGSAVGAAVFGAVGNATIAGRFAHPPAGVEGRLPDDVDATSRVLGDGAHGPVAEFVRSSLYAAAHNVFLGIVLVAVLALAALLLMPRRTVPLVFEESSG
ncbi:MAG: MFS transporter [Actinobacteria bacterium]|nr:MFS transporter [Actinomycetota bacterium]